MSLLLYLTLALCFGGHLVGAQDLCYNKNDVMFVVDESGSIRDSNKDGVDNWELMKQFIVSLTKKFEIGSDYVVAGCVQFGNKGRLSFPFQTDRTTLESEINSLTYKAENTNTSGGIKVMMQSLVNDDSSGIRQDAKNVAIIITDGQSTYDKNLTIPTAVTAREQGVDIYSIGISSNVNENELRLMSSDPQTINKTYWLLSGFGVVESVVNSIVTEICTQQAPPTTTTTTTTTTTPQPTTGEPTTQPPTTTTTTEATTVVRVVTVAGAATTEDNTILIVLIVMAVIFVLLLLALLIVCCCCYGPITACCATYCGCCCCFAREERKIQPVRPVIVPFSTAVVKPTPIVEETTEYGEIGTQCDIKQPVPLPKPLPPPPPPIIKKEVILQPVCHICGQNIQDCMCHVPEPIPSCCCGANTCLDSHGICSICNPHYPYDQYHHISSTWRPDYEPHHHHHHNYTRAIPHSSPKPLRHNYQHHGYTTTTPLVSEAESCSSRIFLVPNSGNARRDNRNRRLPALESPPTRVRGAKKSARRKIKRARSLEDVASDSEEAKNYVYLPLDCPDKTTEESQTYLNRLYNRSSRSHASETEA